MSHAFVSCAVLRYTVKLILNGTWMEGIHVFSGKHSHKRKHLL